MGFSPNYPNVIYVASGRTPARSVYGNGGLVRSTDGGATWTVVNMGLNTTDVNAVAVQPSNPSVVVVATAGVAGQFGGGIYKSINGGDSWQQTYAEGGVVFVSQGPYLYAASYNAILRSSDFGTTWHVLGRFTSLVTTMAVTNGGTTILVGLTDSSSVFIERSTDSGETYSVVAKFQGYSVADQIVVSPANVTRLWALVDHGYANYTSLFTSSDAGGSWSPLNETKAGIIFPQFHYGGGWLAEAPQCIAIDPSNGSVIYIGGPGYVYKSTDGGTHFASLASGLYGAAVGQDNRMIYIDAQGDKIVYVGNNQGLVVSRDGGSSWEAVAGFSSSLLYSVAASGPNIFSVLQDWAPIFSNDSGATWHQAAYGSEEGWVAVDPYNSSVVVVVSSLVVDPSVLVSHDRGTTFFTAQVNETAFANPFKPPTGIAFTNDARHTVYVSAIGGVFRSTDYGRTWSVIPGSPINCYGIAVDPQNPDKIYVSVFGAGTYSSADGGTSWREIFAQVFDSLAVDPVNSSVIAASEYSNNPQGTLVISFDGGNTFQSAGISSTDVFASPPQVYFRQAPGGKLALIYGTNEGLWVSYDFGTTWANYDYNLPNAVVSTLFFSSNESAYLSTYGSGVWYDPDLLNQTYYSTSASLGGYLPAGSSVSIDSTSFSGPGYFALPLGPGPATFALTTPVGSTKYQLTVTGNSVYYYDFRPKTATFMEKGLLSGTSWSASFNGKTATTTGTAPSFSALPGNYAFSIVNITGYDLYPQSGTVDLLHSNLTVVVDFAPQTPTSVPSSIRDFVPVALRDSSTREFSAPFQLMLTIDAKAYGQYEAAGLQNIEFFYANGTVIPSWLESGNFDSAFAVYWLRIEQAFYPGETVTIFMGLATPSQSLFDGSKVGEAPKLSTVYGQFDNGGTVFQFYDNFAGTILGSSWTEGAAAQYYAVNNSLTIKPLHNGTVIYLLSHALYGAGTAFDAAINTFGDKDNVGYFVSVGPQNNTVNPGAYVQDGCGNTYPDQGNNQGEANECGNTFGYFFTTSQPPPGIFSVTLVNSTSSLQTYNYDLGHTHQPISADYPTYPARVGFVSGGSGMSVEWARIRTIQSVYTVPTVTFGQVQQVTTTTTTNSISTISTSSATTATSVTSVTSGPSSTTQSSTTSGSQWIPEFPY